MVFSTGIFKIGVSDLKKLRIAGNGIKIVGLALLLIILFTTVFYLLFRDSNNLIEEMIVNKIQYNASKEIDEALIRLNTEKKKATIISGVETNENIIALTFDGLTDRETMKEIFKLMNDTSSKATFFVPGIEAAEDSDTVKLITENHQKFGNYTLSASKEILNDSQEEQIEDLCRTNVILKTILGVQPTLLKCNTTNYNDAILESAYASNLNQVVSANEYLNYQSFTSYEMTNNYIKNLKKGSIVTIKLDGVLDENEYSEASQPQPPAIDKAPTDTGIQSESLPEEQKLLQVIGWVLKALNENKVKTIYVEELGLVSTATGQPQNQLATIQATASIGTAIVKSSSTLISDNGNKIKPEPIDYPDFQTMIKANDGKKADVVDHLYTSERGVVFTFRGLSNDPVLEKVLDQLDAMGDVKATFFVTADEIEKYPERISKIIERGHDIGNGGVTQDSRLQSLTTEEICKEIYKCDVLLKKIGVETNNYMPGYGYSEGNIREAVAAINESEKKYNLITCSVYMVRNSFAGMNAPEILALCLPVHVYKSLKRGDIAYFRMDSSVFGENDEMIAELVDQLAAQYVFNGYVAVCVESTEEESIYETIQMPLDFKILPLTQMINTYENADSGQLGLYAIQEPSDEIAADKVSPEIAEEMIYSDYIGNPSVSGSNLKGFTDITGIDVSGKVDTGGKNVVFLTFDDWGGDPVVMSILDVLEKHQVEASFFIIAKNVDVDQEQLPEDEQISPNPNLLREMVLRGHDIGSHNYFHMEIDIDDNSNEKEALQTELVKSNQVLSRVVGDITEQKLYFRPPTLAVSKTGLQTVFECGFQKSISGNFSVHDYECKSAEELNGILLNGDDEAVIEPGSVVILHMNNQSGFTAAGLDLFLTENEQKPESERYTFAKLSDYLSRE